MHRSQLETKYLKIKTQTNLKLYKKHKNFDSKLYKRERRKYKNEERFGQERIFEKDEAYFLSNKHNVLAD